ITAADIELPTGSSLITDPASVVLIIAEAPTEAQIDAEMAEAAEELGIVEDAPDADSDAEGGEKPAEGAGRAAEQAAE
ncbi:MAG: hypothetical protein QOJ34_655, partial [Pseudonocardiales bacterium]|nr:hypothetical protein [Pseudonocardiales bacterium]